MPYICEKYDKFSGRRGGGRGRRHGLEHIHQRVGKKMEMQQSGKEITYHKSSQTGKEKGKNYTKEIDFLVK